VARTLTLWQNVESVCAYAYSGFHGDALSLRREWFRKTDFPSHVIWWVADDHVPTFIDSTARLERLYAKGPRPDAFSFKSPFDRDGNPTRMDPVLTREIAERNSPASRARNT